MKKETVQNKLAALLGISEQVEKIVEKKKQRQGIIEGVSEEEIQNFREAQGILYFLQAPALFQYKVCPHCGADFFVSRLYVAFCSYTCIRADLNSRGFEWRKGHDIEALVNDKEVFNGNEPLWIRNLENLESILKRVLDYRSSLTQTE